MEPKIRRTARDTVLTLTLAALLGGGILFILNVVSLGILSYALGVGGVVALVGVLHYVTWGRSLSQDVAGEREEIKVREELEQASEDATAIQDLSQRRGIKRG